MLAVHLYIHQVATCIHICVCMYIYTFRDYRLVHTLASFLLSFMALSAQIILCSLVWATMWDQRSSERRFKRSTLKGTGTLKIKKQRAWSVHVKHNHNELWSGTCTWYCDLRFWVEWFLSLEERACPWFLIQSPPLSWVTEVVVTDLLALHDISRYSYLASLWRIICSG